jgi:hypothetical protein
MSASKPPSVATVALLATTEQAGATRVSRLREMKRFLHLETHCACINYNAAEHRSPSAHIFACGCRASNMPETMLRLLFLRRYQALLVLRGVSPHLLACRQAEMEVLLNLSRFPQKQDSYLKADIRCYTARLDDSPYHIAVLLRSRICRPMRNQQCRQSIPFLRPRTRGW